MRPCIAMRMHLLWTCLLAMLAGPCMAAPDLPPNYSLAPVIGHLNFPTQLAWLPDGTLLIAEKRGVLQAVRNGTLQVAADLSASTNDYWDRGMLGLAVDPDFANNHFVYLNRVHETNASQYAGSKTSQVLRLALDSEARMVDASLVVLVGTQSPLRCNDLPAGADCIPADSSTHSVGDLMFGADGNLYVSNGDASEFNFNDPASLRAQDLDSLSGKVLRVDRNGQGVRGNPFFSGQPNDNRSKVFAYGLRNPWRLAINPLSNSVLIADVGSDFFEELNIGLAGANYGWPCYEGEHQRDLYAFKTACDALYAQVGLRQARVQGPLTGWLHNGKGAAIIGGAVVTGGAYPSSLRGSYLFGDYVSQVLSTVRLDAGDQLSAPVTPFASGFDGIVAIRQGPDGKLYLVQIADASNQPGTGSILRLDYQVPLSNGDCGKGMFKAEYFNGRDFTVPATFTDCEGAPIAHQWGLDAPVDGVAADNFSVRWSGVFHFDGGDTLFQASADDGVRIRLDGATILDGWHDQALTTYRAIVPVAAGDHAITVEYYDQGAIAEIAVNWAPAGGLNLAPVVSIAQPAGHRLVPIGATVQLQGSATDAEDGVLDAAHLQWNLVIQHCADNDCHSHFLQQIAGGSGSFTFPDHGNDQYYVEASLIATDSKGSQSSKTYRLDPDRSTEQCADSTLFKGVYFNNKTLSGPPIATHCSTMVDFYWPTGAAPAPGITDDNFSARYTRDLPLDAGNYVFTVTGDDGVRFYLDGELLIDAWYDQAATAHTAARTLNAGMHTMRLEYYEATEDALIRLNWTK